MTASDHLPIQTRLQTARAKSGRTVVREYTLHGFAWRRHAVPSIDINRLDIEKANDMNVCPFSGK